MNGTNARAFPADRAASRDRHADEVARGERFEFGKNWTRFLAVVDEERVEQATGSLSEMLRRHRCDGS